ncbi:MAG: FAD binding domain-containing protein [Oligoflexia bacterium]|nr:FAD binding domain-containing protein [Oligoflexia bacterium]
MNTVCVRAEKITDIASALSRHYLKIIAGGCTIVPITDPLTGKYGKKYDGFIDISGCRELDYQFLDGNIIRIGATTPVSGILNSAVIRTHAPLLIESCLKLAGTQVRNRATTGGHVVSQPNGDLFNALLCMDALVSVKNYSLHSRTVNINDIHNANGEPVLSDDEFVCELAIPIQKGDGKFIKFRNKSCGTINMSRVSSRYCIGGISGKARIFSKAGEVTKGLPAFKAHIIKMMYQDVNA